MKKAFCKLNKLIPVKTPFVYADIGVMGGIPEKWHKVKEFISVVAFEPDEREYKKLIQSSDYKVFNYAVYKESCPLVFYVTQEGGKSSLLKPNTPLVCNFNNAQRFNIIREVHIGKENVVSLDALARDGKLSYIDFLKIDTQGSELSILEGAQEKILPSLFGAQIEVEFVNMYQNQPLFEDVLAFMRREGLELYDLNRAFWKRRAFYDYTGRGQLIFGDALFFRRLDLFCKRLKAFNNKEEAIAAIAKALVACLVYRVFDYAAGLLDKALEEKVVVPDEYKTLRTLIFNFSKQGVLPPFPGRALLYKVFNALAELFTADSFLGWADRDRWIANVKDR